MILSAIQTETGQGLYRIDGQVIQVHETIESARVAVIQKEHALLVEYPHAKRCSKMDGEDLTVVIELPRVEEEPEPEPAPEPPAPRVVSRRPSYDENPKAFMHWRLGAIRRAAEAIREEMGEIEPADLMLEAS